MTGILHPIEGVTYCRPAEAADYIRTGAWIDLTVGDALRSTAKSFPDRPAFISDERTLTFAEFDESTVRGNRAMARSGGGAVILLGSTDLQPVTTGPSANAELRQYGQNTRWIVRVCEASDLSTVESRFASLSVDETADGSLVIEDPDYGTVMFRKDGTVEAEGRTIVPRDFTVAGEVAMLAAH